MLHTHLHLHVVLTRWTNWQSLGNFQKQCWFGIGVHWIEERNKCRSSCLSRRRKITKTWLDTVSTGATFLDLLCTVRCGHSNGPAGTAPHSCSLIRTAEVGGLCNSSLLNSYQDGRTVLWGWEGVDLRSISPPQSHSHPLVISLWRQVWLYSLHGRTGNTQRHSKTGTSRMHKRADILCNVTAGITLQ